jgi:hypothetical protein|tara:strand:+ start:2294 stop:2398 length:105 start_codon:yes stop_codon:yes gene_type:complete
MSPKSVAVIVIITTVIVMIGIFIDMNKNNIDEDS